MELRVERTYRGPKYTIGHLYIDNKYFCDTLEDPDRGLTSSMDLLTILAKKVKGDTCIPYGKYIVDMDTISPKYSNYVRFPYAKIAKGKMPRVSGVKGFAGILIHAGNTQKDTEGCLLVGYNKVKGQVINSQATWIKLFNILITAHKKREKITIEYIKR
jgi:hypothetical protein